MLRHFVVAGFVSLFVFGQLLVAETLLGSVTGTTASAASAVRDPPSFADFEQPAGRNLPLTFDEAYRLAKLGQRPPLPWTLLDPAHAPAVKRELLSALADHDPEKAAKAAGFLGLCADFSVIEPLLKFALKPGRNDSGIAAAVESVVGILDAKGGEDRSPAVQRCEGETDRFYYMRLIGRFEKEATEWKHTTYAEYHARRVRRFSGG